MCINTDTVLNALSCSKIYHGNFDTNAREFKELFLIFRQAFFQDYFTHLDNIFAFSPVKIRFID